MFFRRKSRRELLVDRLKEQPKVLLTKSGHLIEVGREKGGELFEVTREKSGELLERGRDVSGHLLERGKDLSADVLEKGRDTSIALLEKVRPAPKPKRRGRKVLAAGGAVAAVWFLDPRRGAERRARAREGATRLVRRVRSKVYGLRQRMAHPVPETLDYNDPTLAAKAESELFVGLDVPRDRVKINAENGILVLRGEVDTPEQIKELERAASRIPGVLGVRTLLHVPGQDAPNKAEAIQAS
jgi:BON domain-containing protein